MRLRTHVLALLLPFVLLSCSERKGNAYNPALLALERALDKTPESTAAEVLRTDTLAMDEADKALYNFLLIKARALAPDAMPGPRDEPVLPLAHFEARNDSARLCRIYFYMGRIYVRNYAFFRGNNSYRQAEKFAGSDRRMLAAIKIGEAHIYRFKMMHDDEEKCLQEAYALASSLNDSILMADAMHELAEVHIAKGDLPLAEERLRGALALLPHHPERLAECHKDMGRVYMGMDQLDEALRSLDLAQEEAQTEEMKRDCGIIRGYICLKMHRLKEAGHFFQENVEKLPLMERHKVFFQMARLKREEGDLQAAWDYAQRSIASRDSMAEDSKTGYISNLNAFQEHERQQKRIERMNAELAHMELTFYRLATALSLVLVVSASLIFHFKHSKRKVEVALKEKELAVARLQNSRWESEVKYLREKHEREVAEIESLNQTLEYYKRLNALTVPILMKSRNSQGSVHLQEEEWDIIVQNADACFNHFTHRLKEAFPDLTEEEIRFICLLKMEFPIASLSEVYHIAKGSISRKKMRLKEKMHIEDTTLDDFIRQF